MGARKKSRLARRGQPHQLCQRRNDWNGTDIVFEIDRKNGKTELRFRHVGLVPAFEC